MPSLVEFLRHILPSEGYQCWVALKKGERPQQGFTDTVEKLAAALQQADARGYDAYFACSTYKEPVSRKAENVHRTKSFWLDIDYGTAGHGTPSSYADADHAVRSLDAFCDAHALPYPTVVHSGGGIHAYWQSEKDLDAATWLAAAKSLKKAVAGYGLETDTARTSDIASILRAPGTFNWKLANAPRPVECLELLDGAITGFGAVAVDVGNNQQPLLPALAPSAQAEFAQLNKAVTAIYGASEPSYADLVASQCAQLRSFRDSRGNIPEPLWYAGLGVLGHCDDGDSAAQLWSSGHPNYSFEETEKKLGQARRGGYGPSTCQRFKDLNPAACQGCPFTVTTPLQLGRKPVIPEGVEPPLQFNPPPVTDFPPLPLGYSIRGKQVAVEVKYKDEKDQMQVRLHTFTNYPIFLAEIRDGETERLQGYFFRQYETDRGWIEFEISAKEFEAMGMWGALASHGVKISRKNKQVFSDYVDAYYTMLTVGAKKMRYDQFGWKNEGTAFFYAGSLFKNDGTKTLAAGNTEASIRGKKMQPSKYGNLTNWTAAANKLFMEGCESQSFALLASFAAPLMYFVTPQGEGGAILSLLSPGGGTGKSTVLTAIASVWGELDAIRLLSRDTAVAKFRSMGVLCNIPIIFDELRGRHPELITEFVESFTTGRDRLRGRSDGSVNPVELSWRTILVSASNKSLLDALNSHGDDPLSSRVLEVEAKTPKDAEYSLGNDLSEELLLNKGYAGHAYIDYLLQPGTLEFAKGHIHRLIAHYTKQTNAKPMHRFVIRLLACVAVAAHIVRHMGLLDFSDQRIIEWALAEITKITGSVVAFNPIQILNDILNDCMLANCIIVDTAFHARRDNVVYQMPRHDVQMRYEQDTKRLYVSANFIRSKIMEHGAAFVLVLNELEKQNILLNKARQISLAAGTRLPGGRTACWEIDLSHPAIGNTILKEVLPIQAKAV